MKGVPEGGASRCFLLFMREMKGHGFIEPVLFRKGSNSNRTKDMLLDQSVTLKLSCSGKGSLPEPVFESVEPVEFSIDPLDPP